MAPLSTLTLDDFHFSSMESTEEMTRYVPGGYHPVVIGDIISSPRNGSDGRSRQYRIVNKLGWGSSATVWLAQADSSKAFVAVKVTTAGGNLTREVAMLEAASKVQTNGEQPPHVLNLLDHFTLDGPNGIHSVLVTEVVVPMVSVLSPRRPPLWRKVAAHGLAQAVAHLHTLKIVHGDLYLWNIGLSMPQFIDKDPHDVMQDLGPHHITVVLPESLANQTPSLPAYVIAPCSLEKYYDSLACSDHPQTKIYDFGSSHKAYTLPLSFRCAAEACAPEVVFAQVFEKTANPPVEPPADVWALATAIYEIVTGSSLFNGAGMGFLLYGMASMADSLPPGWKNWYAGLPKAPEVSPSSADAWWASRRVALRRNCADEADTDALVALLRKMLALDPAARPTAAEVLKDAWFLRSAAAILKHS
jgi:serine/threonine protein kinase